MENSDAEPSCGGISSSEDTNLLNRNRSFKSKQLVRSQAIRESTSPPRTLSPASPAADKECNTNPTGVDDKKTDNENLPKIQSSHVRDMVVNDDSSSDVVSVDDKKNKPVEIQITRESRELECANSQRMRARRWGRGESRDLLSNSPRVACVCTACHYCRGRRRKNPCPTKQDSGIACSYECPDWSDTEQSGTTTMNLSKPNSLDVEEKFLVCRCWERRDKTKSLSFSRTDSDDKNELTGMELVTFIKETLNKNARDRVTLLKIERELHSLINDPGRCIVRFPVMTSYGRMLVHRCADLFQLTHNIDHNNKNCVLVSKSGTSGGRIPCTSFKQWCTAAFPPSPTRHAPEHAKYILKRGDGHSLEEDVSDIRLSARSKSLEQREREYERVRRRIFSTENYLQDESQWPWLNGGGPIRLLTADPGRNKLLKVQSLEVATGSQTGKCRGAVSKSHSFGGYGGGEPQIPRLLSRQGDLAANSWRLSPASSGYNTFSLHSTESVTPSPTGGASPEPAASGEGSPVLWLSNLSIVSPGPVIEQQTVVSVANDQLQQTLEPSTVFDPTEQCDNSQQPKSDQTGERKRGKLEKQHSFIDNEYENNEVESIKKCQCECKRNNVVTKETNTETVLTENADSKSEPKSPQKKRQIETSNDIAVMTNLPESQPPAASSNANYNNEHTPKEESEEIVAQNDNYNISHETIYGPNQTQYEPATTYESANQYDPRGYDAINQYGQNDEVAAVHRLQANFNQEYANLQHHQYLLQQQMVQRYRPDEITSPQASNHAYVPQEAMQNVMSRGTPIPVQDPNLRAIGLTNVVYPAAVSQTYPYVNQCRIDQYTPALYPHLVHQQPTEEHKHISVQNPEGTFRIDPSYPYLPSEVAACGTCNAACSDQTLLQPNPRSYNMPYTPAEVPAPTVVQPSFPVNNVMLPHAQPYAQYTEPMQWPMQSLTPTPKMYVQEVYPVLQYPNVYPQYNVMYPQVTPQTYPICQPVYPVIEKSRELVRRNSFNNRHSKRNSLSSSNRTTPAPSEPTPRDLVNQTSADIAVKIQHFKNQLAGAATDRDNKLYRSEDWKRRNSGNGILGSYPTNGYGGRMVRRGYTEDHLNPAAQAIIYSIRNMDSKYNQDRHNNEFQPRNNYQRQDNRNRQRHESENKNDEEKSRQPDSGNSIRYVNNPRDERRASDSQEPRNDANRNRNYNPIPFQYRPPYLLRQVSPNAWYRRSPGTVHPILNPRKPNPGSRNGRR